jgi:hypothetical protein
MLAVILSFTKCWHHRRLKPGMKPPPEPASAAILATIQKVRSVAEQHRKAGAEPISRHPLFPAIVALWCGALCGLGSILIGPATVERIVVSLGIDRVVPMAAPPLGTTMRILLALAATGLGAAIGMLVARRAARPAAVPEPEVELIATQAVEFAPADPEPVEAKPGRIAGRRRALALGSEHDVPAYDDRAALPRHDAQILHVAEFDLDGFENPDRATDTPDADEPADLPAWLDAESAWHEPAADRPAVPPFEQVLQAQIDQQAEEDSADEPIEAAPFAAPTAGDRLSETYSREISARTEEAARAEPGFKLLPRLHSATAWSDEPVPPFVPAPAAEAPVPVPAPAPSVTIAANDTVPEPRAAARIAEADLDDLSPVELLERLALAMAERRAQARRDAEIAAEAAATPIAVEFAPLREVPPVHAPDAPAAFARIAPGPFAAIAPFAPPVIESDIAAEETIETSALPVPPEAPLPIPAALRPVAFGDDLADEPLPGYVPPRHIGLAAVDTPLDPPARDDTSATFAPAPFPASPFVAEDAIDDEEDTVLQQGYSSLLTLSRQAGGQPRFAQAPAFAPEPQDEGSIHDLLGDEAREAVPFARPTLASSPASVGNTVPTTAPATGERLFDAPGRPDQEATERALRAALATLQRMSGAA